jgi:hypothetical protein
VGLWQSLLGRSRPKPARLDSLFAVPTAALTVESALGLRPTGSASVCFRAATGPAFQQTRADILALLDADDRVPPVGVTEDGFGFTWFELHRPAASTGELCADLHVANTLLEEQGFGGGLLCSLVVFAGAGAGAGAGGRRVGLVYLYKQGTFYPFAPAGGRTRETLLELQVAEAVSGDLPVEDDRQRWLALWGAPGL